MDSGNWFCENKDRETGAWNYWAMAMAAHAGNVGFETVDKICPQISAIFPQISAIHSRKFPRYIGIFWFWQKTCGKPVFTSRESLAQSYHPILLGIAFFISSAKLNPYYVLERAATVCEEPENPWNNKKMWKSFPSGASKSRFCKISHLFRVLWAPQVAIL